MGVRISEFVIGYVSAYSCGSCNNGRRRENVKYLKMPPKIGQLCPDSGGRNQVEYYESFIRVYLRLDFLLIFAVD